MLWITQPGKSTISWLSESGNCFRLRGGGSGASPKKIAYDTEIRIRLPIHLSTAHRGVALCYLSRDSVCVDELS